MIFRIVIPTQHYKETVIFYRDVLGFNLLSEKDGLGFLKSSVSSELALTVQSITADSDYAATGHGMFLKYLVPRLETLKQRLLEHGISWAETSNGVVDSVLIRDPNGNVVLVEAIASANVMLPQSDHATDIADMELSFIASAAREMAYAARQLVEQLRSHGITDTLVEPIRQLRLSLDILWKEAYQVRDRLVINSQLPIEQYHYLAKRFVELSRELYPLLNPVARTEGIESDRETQRWIGVLKSYIESMEEIPMLSSIK